MKKAILLTGTLLLLLQISYGQYTTADIKQYIATYSDVAVKKMQEFGIPASITLAQGILESGAGTSDLARIAIAGDTREMGSIPESGRCPGVGNDSLLQYSCLENSLDRGSWWATVHGVVESWTGLNE